MEFAVCLHTERLDSFSTTAERDYEPKVSSFVVLFVFFLKLGKDLCGIIMHFYSIKQGFQGNMTNFS